MPTKGRTGINLANTYFDRWGTRIARKTRAAIANVRVPYKSAPRIIAMIATDEVRTADSRSNVPKRSMLVRSIEMAVKPMVRINVASTATF